MQGPLRCALLRIILQCCVINCIHDLGPLKVALQHHLFCYRVIDVELTPVFPVDPASMRFQFTGYLLMLLRGCTTVYNMSLIYSQFVIYDASLSFCAKG